MKSAVKSLLQRILGYRRFLRMFAWFKVKTLHRDSREDDFRYFLSLLPENGTVLDIGANLGFLSYYLAKHVKNGQVVAFEPMPDNLDALHYVIKKFRLDNVRVEACALGDRDGEAEMVLPLFGKSKEQGLSHMVHEKLTDHNEGIRFKVPLRKLDSLSYLFDPGVNVTGIKMDVENFEQFVLAGAVNLLDRHHPLIYIELWENENRDRCFAIVNAAGYTVKIHVNGKLENYDPAKHADKINMFMVPGGAN